MKQVRNSKRCFEIIFQSYVDVQETLTAKGTKIIFLGILRGSIGFNSYNSNSSLASTTFHAWQKDFARRDRRHADRGSYHGLFFRAAYVQHRSHQNANQILHRRRRSHAQNRGAISSLRQNRVVRSQWINPRWVYGSKPLLNVSA